MIGPANRSRSLLALTATVGLLTVACSARAPVPSSNAARPSPSVSASITADPEAGVAWIAYQADDLRLIRPDGGGSRKALPNGPTNARHPDWSPDGTRFVFVTDEADTRDIWMADWDGGNAHRIFDCKAPCVDADGPSWSPDGGAIAFRRYDSTGGTFPGSQLEIVDLDTGAITTAATTTAPDFIDAVRWSRDGRSLVMNIDTYSQPVTDDSPRMKSAIAVLSLDDPTQELRRITDLDTFPQWPDWSPTQDLILFQVGMQNLEDLATTVVNLFTIRPDGTGLTQLTFFGLDGPAVWLPAWAPDGLSILMTVTARDGGGHHTLGTLLADGTGLRLIPGPVGGAHPRQRPMPTQP